jgi:mono/diheme cytochrome c family protein
MGQAGKIVAGIAVFLALSTSALLAEAAQQEPSPKVSSEAVAKESPPTPQKPPSVSEVAFRKPMADGPAGMLEEGKNIFRFDTFGSEAFWGDTLKLHEAVAGSALGGVGPGLSPKMALGLGLKVDSEVLPAAIVEGLKQGTLNVDQPAVTLELLKLDAVLGVKGVFDEAGNLKSLGIQCAICHSVVDDSLAPGVGRRLDGWANRDLNIGAIIGLAPNLQAFADILGIDVVATKTALNGWGPGRFDAELILDGKAFRPDGKTSAVLLPPAFGLAGVNLHTWVGWGAVSHWNAYVANLAMHGKGVFFDPRLNNPEKFPVAVKNGFFDVRNDQDLVTSKLAPLHFYQLSLKAPAPPEGSFNREAAARGKVLFTGKAECAKCHVPPLFTEPGWNMRKPEEVGIDGFHAKRSPDGRYRTSPLRGLWTHSKGGFFHDGQFKTLNEVVDHFNQLLNLGLTPQEKADLVEFLKAI